MTLKEIAEIAGVSPSTVSRVIHKNDGKCASKAVQDRIWDIVGKTGYQPNKFAQGLKLSKETEDKKADKKGLLVFLPESRTFIMINFFHLFTESRSRKPLGKNMPPLNTLYRLHSYLIPRVFKWWGIRR